MRNWALAYSILFAAFAGLFSSALAQNVSEKQAYELAREAYLYAYPIVSMDTTMRQATNVPNADTVPMRAPVNQFAHVRAYPTADQRDAREPMVLLVADTDGRYYLLQMLDMWSDVFATVGSRTTGTKAGNYALVSADWNGTLPPEMEKIVAPTTMVWILGRTQTNGPADYANVHKVQNGYKLTPLSQWGTNYIPPPNLPCDRSIDR